MPIGEEKLHLLQLMSPFDQPKPPSSQTRLQFALHSFGNMKGHSAQPKKDSDEGVLNGEPKKNAESTVQ